MQRDRHGRQRSLAGNRRPPTAPRKRKRNDPIVLPWAPSPGPPAHGFEVFLPRRTESVPAYLSGVPGGAVLFPPDETPEPSRAEAARKGAFTVSTILHTLLFLFVAFEPELVSVLGIEPALRVEERPQEPERLVLFMEPEAGPAPAPETAAPPSPAPPPPQDDRLLIPRATRPAPPDKQPEIQNNLPFSEGNTEEFYTDQELKEPGEEGEPGEPNEEPESEAGAAEEPAAPVGPEPERRVADLLPRDFFFHRPLERDPARPPLPEPGPLPGPETRSGENGERGQGGAFEDIRRFLRDKRFHNPDGGLVTGKNNTLYFNDKGANFVPWIHRMLSEVKRNWLVPYSAAFQAGHVAVAVAVSRSGQIVGLEVLIPSGTAGFDNAAVGALRAAQLLPLPNDYPDDRFEFVLVFWYNERPYDIF